jgi:hypothetical protein
MAIFFSSTNSKRHGPQHSKDNASHIVVVKNPVKADDWATFQSKIVAQAPITGADINITEVGGDLQVTVNGKNDIDQSQAALVSDDICMAIIDSAGEEIKYCLDAVDKVITNADGDKVDLPQITFFIREFKAA